MQHHRSLTSGNWTSVVDTKQAFSDEGRSVLFGLEWKSPSELQHASYHGMPHAAVATPSVEVATQTVDPVS
jgi:hypothetical protein